MPAIIYGAETWATTKKQEKRIEINEMIMLQWMCGVTEESFETSDKEERTIENKMGNACKRDLQNIRPRAADETDRVLGPS